MCQYGLIFLAKNFRRYWASPCILLFYIKRFSHDLSTTVFSMIGLKLVCEELWRLGCFYYAKNSSKNVAEILITIPSRNLKLTGSRIPNDHFVIVQQLQNFGMIQEIDEPTFNEDLLVLDYSIQTGAGTFNPPTFK